MVFSDSIDSCPLHLKDEAPLYILAIQGFVKLFVSEWAFPIRGWKGPMKATQFIFAWGMIGLACSTAVHDVMNGLDYLEIAWTFIGIVWPSLLCGVFFFFIEKAMVMCTSLNSVWQCDPKAVACTRYASVLFLVIIPILSTFYMNWKISRWPVTDPKYFLAFNCGSLTWSSTSQIVSVIQSLALLYQFYREENRHKDIHWTRLMTLLPWVLLNIIFYFPVLTLLFATHVIPSAAEFLPVTLVTAALLACYVKIILYVHDKVYKEAYRKQELLLKAHDEQDHTWAGWWSDRWNNYAHHQDWEREQSRLRSAAFDLEVGEITFRIKSAAVPFMLVVKFLGEVIVRYRLGNSWWHSVWNTWSERTMMGYLTLIYKSVFFKLSFVTDIL